MRTIEVNELFDLTGLHPDVALELTGVFGCKAMNDSLFPFALKADFKIPENFEESQPNRVKVTVECTLAISQVVVNVLLIRVIDKAERGISNVFIGATQTKMGIGLAVLNSQIQFAKKYGYDEISCIASGWYNHPKKLNGYITWAKLGFSMYGIATERKFHQTLLTDMPKYAPMLNQQNFKSPNDLVSDVDGEKFWELRGFSWNAKFDLSRNTNEVLLDKYKQKKLAV